ncbi:MAG: hypothetical protein DKT66_27800 [Candidatus Melainabacteria bacterium]|nr:MAG: hypothetical protein DKT66_27800 [Candidatus Melainabacteria bacterium]
MPRRSFGRHFVLSLGVIALGCGILAVARVCHVILTVGGNNISNDYLDVVPAINFAFSGKLDGSNFLSALKVGQHFVALPMAFHLLSAYFFDWNARAELLIGVGLNLVRSLLLFDLLAHRYKKEWRLLVFGAVLALVFSMTQASIHFFGQACFPVSLATLGFTVALWGLVRFKDWRGISLMLAGGISSAASMGNVPACWAALLVAAVLCGYRLKERNIYIAWVFGAISSFAPYLFFHSAQPSVLKYCQHWFDPLFFINVIGRPFANQIGLHIGRLPLSEFAGGAGLALFLFALAASWRLKNFDTHMKASLALCTYGLVSAAMLSCVRTYVCPWYCGFTIYFWIGVVGLLMSLLQGVQPKGNIEKTDAKPRLSIVLKTLCVIGLFFIPVMYAASNRTWKDKHVYLSTRSPASEAGLRNFREAPSYIEGLLFQWGDGQPHNVTNIALPLEKYQLSAFAPDQTWSLQGDFVLPRVRVFNTASVPPVRFIENDTADHAVPWSYYEHANVYVHSPNAISWTIPFPADLRSARFRTALKIGSPSKRVKPVITDGVTGKVYAITESAEGGTSHKELLQEVHIEKADQWAPVDLDLARFRGKKVTLVLTTNGGKDHADDIAIFRYPTLEVKLHKRTPEENALFSARMQSDKILWRPVNTDLNVNFGKDFDQQQKLELPPLTAQDWHSSPFKINLPTDITGAPKGRTNYAAMSYTPTSPIPVSDFSHLLVSVGAPRMYGRALKVMLVLDSGSSKIFSIPLPADKGIHLCSYELKLCELPINCCIKQLVLYPASAPGVEKRGTTNVYSVLLIKEKTPSWLGQLK